MNKEEIIYTIIRRGYFQNFPYPEAGFTYDEAEVRLFRAVLDRALADLLKGPEAFERKPEIFEDVERWFDLDNEDFQQVCTMAFFESDWAYYKMLEILEKYSD